MASPFKDDTAKPEPINDDSNDSVHRDIKMYINQSF